ARVERAGRRAREVLLESARRVGAELGALEKDARDAPLPSQGWHWSIAHAGGRVAGAVARHAVGVDLEPLREPRGGVAAHALREEERALLGPGPDGFVRGWTAKEAVLKKLGVGLSELSRCRIVAVPSASEVELEHDGRPHRVHQHRLADAICAVSVDGPARRVRFVEEHAA
ncbi:MAG TPA: 4'-phosphopantetheinyl transferase superfamily protein, partial [Planctomycetota bacterium]|nr:4'-phosphopantetheinyl transferase superfamily protein [Planctomycetota bacterium]